MIIEKKELFELFYAWVLISLAFSIALFREDFLEVFFLSFVCVGLGFLLHELAHKFTAIKFGVEARFHADNKMLVFALITSFLGIILASPGYVKLKGFFNEKISGIVAFFGPFTNLVLALFFLPLSFFEGYLGVFGQFGFFVNSYLGLFNMVPIDPFDGRKIWVWSKFYYLVLAISLLILTVFAFI